MDDARACNYCGEEKPLTDFPKIVPNARSGYRGGYSRQCHECRRQSRRLPRTCPACGNAYIHKGSAGARRKLCEHCAEVGRICTRCEEYKPLDRFYLTSTGGLAISACRDGCALAANRERKYGVAPEQHAALASSDIGPCPICNRADVKMALDHDHATGTIRGIICTRCNVGLGMFGDSVDALLAAVAYVKSHSPRV